MTSSRPRRGSLSGRSRDRRISPPHPACSSDIELGDQLAADQGRRRHGATDLVRVLSLRDRGTVPVRTSRGATRGCVSRSEEHTSELQSRPHLVCRLLLEKKKNNTFPTIPIKKTKNNRNKQ